MYVRLCSLFICLFDYTCIYNYRYTKLVELQAELGNRWLVGDVGEWVILVLGVICSFTTVNGHHCGQNDVWLNKYN